MSDAEADPYRDGPIYARYYPDDVRVDTMDFGCTIGIAFSKGGGETRKRWGTPLSREQAKRVHYDIGRLLGCGSVASDNRARQAYGDGRVTALRHVFQDGLTAVLGEDKAREIREKVIAWAKENPEPSADDVLFGKTKP